MSLKFVAILRRYVLMAFVIAFPCLVAGQLSANFTSDKNAGCSPLKIAFLNTSTGFSENAIWSWDFGNGNTSALRNPGAIFLQEGSYNVKLRVTDGTQVAEITKIITVYSKPDFDFTVSPANGCTPLTTQFSTNKTGGDGAITSWRWDFGDGTTELSYAPGISHTYFFKLNASVSVTATSEYGCSNTKLKQGMVAASSPILIQFSSNQQYFCSSPATVNFINSSTGEGSIQYQWDFGDGTKSTAVSPSHTYTSPGRFNVILTATSADGCVVSKTETDYILVDDFNADFDVPVSICHNKYSQFKITSSPQPTATRWLINGVPVTEYSSTELTYLFPGPGTYTVQMINEFGTCQRQKTKQVIVKQGIQPDQFVVTNGIFCASAPFPVNFMDTTSGAIKWTWNFQYYHGSAEVSSTVQSPDHSFTSPGSRNIRLEVENTAGCTGEITQWINIEPLYVNIYFSDPGNFYACDSITKQFGANSNQTIATYLWEFGDGETSTEAMPVHTFRKRGEFNPILKYTTADGCTGSTSYGPGVRVMQKPNIEFNVQSEVCGSSYVHINPQVTGDYHYIFWDFGDNTGISYNASHQYWKEGTYDITAIAFNNACNDTIYKSQVITAKGPFAKIGEIDYTCDGDRNTITFPDLTTSNVKWTWDFGDGTTQTSTTYQPVLSHTYQNTNTYELKLKAENGSCIQWDTKPIWILKKQKPKLSFTAEDICISQPVNFKITNLEPFNYILSDPSPRYNFENWEWKDGTPFMGIPFNGSSYWYANNEVYMVPEQVKKDSIRLITRSYFHSCLDTSDYVLLNVKGVTTNFSVTTNNVCFKSPIVFQDNSVATAGSSIVTRTWDFGDGQQLVTTAGGTVRHTYNTPGYYIVRLSVSDNSGCISSQSNASSPVIVTGAKASFVTSPGNPVAPLNPVNFINTSYTGYAGAVSYQWDFGDGGVATTEYATHTYTTPGNYPVRLIVIDQSSGCRDTMIQQMNIVSVPAFTTNTLLVGSNGSCPPVQASFFFNPTSPYTKLEWDFGDGITLNNHTNPVHIYTQPGRYLVTLKVYNGVTLLNTSASEVIVSRPPVSIAAADLSACKGDTIELYSTTANNNFTYAWDFGNGEVKAGSDTIASAAYPQAGTYSPNLIITDDKGCASSIKLTESIIVHPDPVISVSPNGLVNCKAAGIQLEAAGAISYVWSPAQGLSSTTISNPVANPISNTSYTIAGTDIHGCTGQHSIPVTVPQPFQLTSVSSFDICKGEKKELNVSGAHSYQWINNITGLNATAISNPVASPSITSTYTVVGFDQYQCYSDTSPVLVQVRESPSVVLGNDLQTILGTALTLQSTASSDVVRWEWIPSDYLNCSNCPSPISKPLGSIEYKLRVYNQYNCSSVDSIKIEVSCGDGKMYIPTAFTPNNDGSNDVFGIPSQGISKVISFRIFNRWGEIIFQKKDYVPGAADGNWDGRYKGMFMDSGVYVYLAEVECTKGIRFQLKGTVTLVR